MPFTFLLTLVAISITKSYQCLGKKDVIEKIAEKEMKEEIRVIEMEENIDFDIPKQDEILEQIFGEK